MPIQPSFGLRIVVEDDEAKKRIKQHTARMEQLEALHRNLGLRTELTEKKKASASKSTADAVEKSSKKQMSALRKLRWEMVTYLFFVRLISKAVKAAYAAMAESAETAESRMGARALARTYEVNLGPLAASLRDVVGMTMSVQESIAVVTAGIIQDQGRFVDEYAKLWEAAQVAGAVAGVDAKEMFSAFVQTLMEGTGAAADAVTPIFNLQYAIREYAQEQGKAVEEITHAEAAQVLLNQIQVKTNELMDEGAREALKQAQGFKHLKASWEDFKDVTGVMLEGSKAVDTFATALDTLLQVSMVTMASLSGMGAVLSKILEGDLFDYAQMYASSEALDIYQEAFQKSMKRGADALGLFSDEVDDTERTYNHFIEEATVDVDPIINHLMKREAIMERHAYNIEKIHRRHEQRLADIELKFQQTLARIDRDTRQAQTRARRRYDSQVETATIRFQQKMAYQATKYFLEREQAQRKFNLKMLQNEALYRYERMMLVAEGDVLGIEDLDARYALETAKENENFQEQTRSDEENFQLQQARTREQFQEQLREMLANYDERLREIRIRETNQIEEAQQRRDNDHQRAIQDLQQRLEEEERTHQRSLKQWNEYWDNIARQTQLGAEMVRDIINDFFGPGGEADAIIEDFMRRSSQWADWSSRVRRITGWGSYYSGQRTWEETPIGQARRRQHGGQDIVSRPTSFTAGESGTEVVTVSPLSTVGGSLSLSWGGGSIPVHGTGELGGVDLSGLGDSIAQGLLLEMIGQLRRS